MDNPPLSVRYMKKQPTLASCPDCDAPCIPCSGQLTAPRVLAGTASLVPQLIILGEPETRPLSRVKSWHRLRESWVGPIRGEKFGCYLLGTALRSCGVPSFQYNMCLLFVRYHPCYGASPMQAFVSRLRQTGHTHYRSAVAIDGRGQRPNAEKRQPESDHTSSDSRV